MRLSLSFLFVICGLFGYAQVIENPVFDRTDQPLFHVDKVELTQDSTIIYCTYDAEIGSWANISSETYLEETLSGKKYTILKSDGLPFAPQQRLFNYAERCNIKLSFPAIHAIDKINLIESPKEKAFNIFGISLKESNDCASFSNIEKAMALSSKAEFYASVENYTKAIEYESQAMSIKKALLGRLSEPYEYSVSMLGKYYSDIRCYDKAIYYFSEDLNLIKEIAGVEYDGYAITLSVIGTCYENKGSFIDALEILNQALNIANNNKNVKEIDRARIISSIANVYMEMGDLHKAIQYATEGFSIKQKYLREDDLDYISSLGLLADMYSTFNQAKACEYGHTVVDLSIKYFGNSHPITMKSVSDLSKYYIESEQYSNALSYANKALEMTKQIEVQDSILIGTILYNVGLSYQYSKEYEKAIDYYNESLNNLKEETSIIYQNIAQCYAYMNDFTYAIKYAEKAINALKNRLMTLFTRMTYKQRYLYWQDNHCLLDFEYPFYVSKSLDNNSISNLFNMILYKKGITKNTNSCDTITWRTIKGCLSEEDLAIEFVTILNQEDNSIDFYALSLGKNYSFPKMIKLFKLGELNSITNLKLNLYEQNRMLGELVWKPLYNEIRNKKNIYFSPTHILHSIAIEFLPFNDWVNISDKFNMFRLSSTGLLADKRGQSSFKNAVLFGGLNYDNNENNNLLSTERNGFDPLFNTFDEIMSISGLLNTKNVPFIVYTDKDGTEARLKNLADSTISILHLATHGMNVKSSDVSSLRKKNNFHFLKQDFDNGPQYIDNALSRSFLVLSNGNSLISETIQDLTNDDGIITASEISELDFNQIDLVVLSACETANGEFGLDDSIMGLQYAFKLAGANTILMSLDKVDDEATKILMVEFYRNLMDGKTKINSLREAQRYLRNVENGKYSDPKFWASFIMLDGLN